MRTHWLAVMFLVATGVAAQVAPNVDAGASPEAVLRAFGWPRGRSASADREVWHYDAFDVTFDHGHVVYVAPVPGVTQPVRTPPSSRAATPIHAAPVPPPRRASPGAPMAQASEPGAAPREGNRSVRPSSNASEGDPLRVVTRSLLSLVGVLGLIVGAFVVLFGVVAVCRRRIRRARAAQAVTGAPSPAMTAKDAIAATLARFHAKKSGGIPPVLGSSDRVVSSVLTMERLRELEWKRFELIVARYFEATGWRCQLTCVGADGGVDAYLYRNAEPRPFAAVQCKAWTSYRVSVKEVRELFGVMAAEQTSEGFFVTTAAFTDEARRWAMGKPLQLLDGDEFLRRYNALGGDVRARIEAEVFSGDFRTPTCARCDVKLVLRLNSQDNSTFWGCPNFPRCRYTIKPAGAEK